MKKSELRKLIKEQIRIIEQNQPLTINTIIPNITITGSQSQQITWSGPSGPGPVYITLIDVGNNINIADLAVLKEGGNSFNWNMNCNTPVPTGGTAMIFIAKLPQGFIGAYDPNAIVAYNYSNEFMLTNNCGGPVKPKMPRRR